MLGGIEDGLVVRLVLGMKQVEEHGHDGPHDKLHGRSSTEEHNHTGQKHLSH